MLLYGLSDGNCPAGETYDASTNACYDPNYSYGSSSNPGNCPAGEAYNAAGNYCYDPNYQYGSNVPGTVPKPPAGQSAGTPWYTSLTQAFATGITKGLTTPGVPVVAPTQSWYETPAGIGVILLGGIALVFLLKK